MDKISCYGSEKNLHILVFVELKKITSGCCKMKGPYILKETHVKLSRQSL